MTRAIFIEPTHFESMNVEDFGEIVYLYGVRETKPSIFDEKFKDNLRERLESISYNPTEDYIVISGTFVMLTTCVGFLASMYGNFNALQFHAGIREYVPVKMGANHNARIRA